MPAPPHYRITYSGTLGRGGLIAEIWSMSINMSLPDSVFLVRSDMASRATLARAAWATHVAPRVLASVQLRKTRFAAISSSGLVPRDADGAYVQGDDLTVQAGGGGLSDAPPQTALAVTLQTPAAGATGRGRFYLPMPFTGTLGDDLRMTVANTNGHRDAMAAFLNSLNSTLGPQNVGRVCVASGGSTVNAIPPALRPVTEVKVGRVIDTIRSRRNALEENYSVGAITG